MGRFTERFKDALGDYLQFVLRSFELGDWRISLMPDPPDGAEAEASIKAIYGRRLAELRLSLDFFDYDREHQEHYIIHEMCHLFSEGIDNVVSNGPETLMGKPAYTIFFDQFLVQIELMTDQLAYCFQNLLGSDEYNKLLNALVESEKEPTCWPSPTGERHASP